MQYINALVPFCDSSKIMFAATQLQEQCFGAGFEENLFSLQLLFLQNFRLFDFLTSCSIESFHQLRNIAALISYSKRYFFTCYLVLGSYSVLKIGDLVNLGHKCARNFQFFSIRTK